MENFRAKQYENLDFEGEVFSGGPCGCDYCMGECEDCKEIIEKLEEENKNLREKIKTLELRLDNKEKLNKEYRKQLDKLRTDNIYEEGLYD